MSRHWVLRAAMTSNLWAGETEGPLDVLHNSRHAQSSFVYLVGGSFRAADSQCHDRMCFAIMQLITSHQLAGNGPGLAILPPSVVRRTQFSVDNSLPQRA